MQCHQQDMHLDCCQCSPSLSHHWNQIHLFLPFQTRYQSQEWPARPPGHYKSMPSCHGIKIQSCLDEKSQNKSLILNPAATIRKPSCYSGWFNSAYFYNWYY